MAHVKTEKTCFTKNKRNACLDFGVLLQCSLYFQQPIICQSAEDFQKLLSWTQLCPICVPTEVNVKKTLNRITEGIKPEADKSEGCTSGPLQFKSNCSGFPIVKTLTLDGRQLQDLTHADKTQTGP